MSDFICCASCGVPVRLGQTVFIQYLVGQGDLMYCRFECLSDCGDFFKRLPLVESFMSFKRIDKPTP